jgi:homoserine O-acetyltransferase
MNTLFKKWSLICFVFIFSNAKGQDPKFISIEKIFQLGDFRLENDLILPHAFIKFATYGKLNKEKNNVLVLPSSYGADYRSYDFLIGSDKAIDTNQYFVILTQLFANGHSSSPSNTKAPFDGPRFPNTTILDNVKAQYALVHDYLNVKKIKAVIGFSMGAQQAFQWAISYPNYVQSIIPFCGTAKTYPHGFARLEAAISTIEADDKFNNGNYTTQPIAGLKAWSLHWASWFLSQEWYRQEKFKTFGNKSVNAFLQARIEKDKDVDANDRIAQAKTWQSHDISKNTNFNGDIEKALSSIPCKVLYMPSLTDLYFPIAEVEYEKAFIKQVVYIPIPSIWGHLAGAGINPEDNLFLNKQIRSFLLNATPPVK